MEMHRVSSSAISAVGYDPDTQQMKIRFVQGSTAYTFCRVPQHIYEGLLSAGSNRLVRNPL